MKKLHAGTLFTIVQVSVMVEVGASVSQVLGIDTFEAVFDIFKTIRSPE